MMTMAFVIYVSLPCTFCGTCEVVDGLRVAASAVVCVCVCVCVCEIDGVRRVFFLGDLGVSGGA